MGTGRSPWAGVGLAAGVLLVAAGAARADEESLRRELEQTRGEVRRLLERVEELEGRLAKEGTPDDALRRAVDDYLAERPAGVGANVTAPGLRSLRFSGQILVWGERWDRSYRPADPAGDDVQDIGWLRASLQADAEITDSLRARIEIRDARYFGQEPSTTTQLQAPGAGTDLKQGWFEHDDLFGGGVRTRAGRQVLSYGDERLVGELDWTTYGRSFDGLLFSREVRNTMVDLFATRVVERGAGTVVPGVDDDDREFFGVYTRTPKALHHSDLDLFVLLLKDRMDAAGEAGGVGTTTVWTGGFRIAGVKGNFDWGAEAAYQRGHLAGDPLSAWAGHARLGYTLADAPWTPRVGLEWDRATGDTDPTDGTVRSFQTLFPTNHKHYGILDAAAWQNLRAYRASLTLKPAAKWTVAADLWRLYLDESEDAWYSASGAAIRPGVAGGASRYLGSEIDLVVTWKAEDHLTVAVGGAQFFDGGFVRDTGSDGDTLWMYVRVTVAF